LEDKNNLLERENSLLRNENLDLKKIHQDKTQTMKRVVQLEKEKARLIMLMKQSEEFKLLGSLAGEDSQISFLHNAGCFSNYDVSRIEVGKVPQAKVKDCQKERFRLEEQLWVDSDIWKFAEDLRIKFEGNFSETVIEYLLLGLNTRFLSKIKSFRNSAHLFCKFCKGNNKQLLGNQHTTNNMRLFNGNKTLKFLKKGNFC
jgi:hypothetical protein